MVSLLLPRSPARLRGALITAILALPIGALRAQPADSLAIVEGYLAWHVAPLRQQPAWPDSLIEVTVALGGRAGARLREVFADAPLHLGKFEVPLRTLVIDSLLFHDTAAVLYTTQTGRSAEPEPWWETTRFYWFRWNADERRWQPYLAAGSVSDGFWRHVPASSHIP